MHRLALIALGATLLAGCGGDGGGTADRHRHRGARGSLGRPGRRPPIVGGLTVNAADGMLVMTTNTGMFRIEQDAKKPAARSTRRTARGRSPQRS